MAVERRDIYLSRGSGAVLVQQKLVDSRGTLGPPPPSPPSEWPPTQQVCLHPWNPPEVVT